MRDRERGGRKRHKVREKKKELREGWGRGVSDYDRTVTVEDRGGGGGGGRGSRTNFPVA